MKVLSGPKTSEGDNTRNARSNNARDVRNSGECSDG